MGQKAVFKCLEHMENSDILLNHNLRKYYQVYLAHCDDVIQEVVNSNRNSSVAYSRTQFSEKSVNEVPKKSPFSQENMAIESP